MNNEQNKWLDSKIFVLAQYGYSDASLEFISVSRREILDTAIENKEITKEDVGDMLEENMSDDEDTMQTALSFYIENVFNTSQCTWSVVPNSKHNKTILKELLECMNDTNKEPKHAKVFTEYVFNSDKED